MSTGVEAGVRDALGRIERESGIRVLLAVESGLVTIGCQLA